MTITPTEIANIAIAVGGVVTLIFVGVVNVITARKVNAVKETVAVIKEHVNSEQTAAQGREDSLIEQNRLLREVLEESKATARMLAQSTATAAVPAPLHTTPSVLAATVTNGPSKTLENIEVHTEKTAQNTAKTDATIQDMKDQKP